MAPRAVISEPELATAEDDSAGDDSTTTKKAPPLIGGMTPVGGSASKNGNAKVQALADEVKDQVPSKLREQGWNLGLGSFTVLSYCEQVVAGMNYILKVEIDDDKVAPVASGGEVLQLRLFQPLGSSNGSISLSSVQMVSRDDRNCDAMPLTPPPALPHVVFDATPDVQQLADTVKEKVPAMLALSGWRPSLEPYKALNYCSDSANYIIKVKVADCLDKNCTYPIPYQLQLLIHVPHGKSADEAVLTGALMVKVVDGNCASLPVLPTLDQASAQALALGDVTAQNASGLAQAAAVIAAEAAESGNETADDLVKVAKSAADGITAAIANATESADDVADNVTDA